MVCEDLTLSHGNGSDGVSSEVAKGELVMSTGIGDSGSGSNVNEKGLTRISLGGVVVLLDLMRLCRLGPREYLK